MPSKDLIAASARPLVLSILAEGETYGYAIIHRVRDLSGGRLAWTDGMLYPVLHRLERQGLVKSTWRTAETGRKRKYYKLVKAGVEALSQEQAEWMAVHNSLAVLWGLEVKTA